MCQFLYNFAYNYEADMNLYLELEDYLAQWFINDQGGNNPVRLIRGSME